MKNRQAGLTNSDYHVLSIPIGCGMEETFSLVKQPVGKGHLWQHGTSPMDDIFKGWDQDLVKITDHTRE